MDLVFYLCQPQSGMEIAQAAFAFLDLRLQQIDRFAVLGVALAGFLELGLEKLVLIAVETSATSRPCKLRADRVVAGEEARVEDGGLLLQIAPRHAHAFARVADSMADDRGPRPTARAA